VKQGNFVEAKRFFLRTITLVFFLILTGGAALFGQEADDEEPIDWRARWRPENRWFIGPYAGYSHNTLFTGGSEQIMYFTTFRAGHGTTVGLPIRFHIFTWFAIQVEANYIMKNYTMRRTGDYGYLEDKNTNSFVNFPVIFHFAVPLMNGPVSLFANTGFYMGLWAASRRQGRAIAISTPVYDYDEMHTFDSRYDNRFESGLLAGFGIQYNFRRLSLFAEWRYNYGLTDLHKQMQLNQAPYLNDTWTIHTGILFNGNLFKRYGGKNQ